MTQKLTAKAVESLPLASDTMSKDELRQLCLAYFELQLSFHWTPSRSVTDYPSTYANVKKTLDKGTVYGGIPYQSLGTGNLYRWLEYYDEATKTAAMLLLPWSGTKTATLPTTATAGCGRCSTSAPWPPSGAGDG